MLLFVLRYSLQSLCFALVNNAVILRLAIAISQDSCKTKMTGVSPGELNDMTTERSSNVRHAAIATWRFGKIAVEAARGSLSTHGTALDAVEKGRARSAMSILLGTIEIKRASTIIYLLLCTKPCIVLLPTETMSEQSEGGRVHNRNRGMGEMIFLSHTVEGCRSSYSSCFCI